MVKNIHGNSVPDNNNPIKNHTWYDLRAWPSAAAASPPAAAAAGRRLGRRSAAATTGSPRENGGKTRENQGNPGKPRKTMENLWKNQQKPKETKENQVPAEENANVSWSFETKNKRKQCVVLHRFYGKRTQTKCHEQLNN